MIKAKELKRIVREIGRTDDETKLLTANEFAQMYGYSPSSMRVLLSRGKISKAFKLGNEWLIPENSVINVKQYKKKNVTKGAKIFET